MNDIFGYMVGPKAENFDLMKKLITDALDDHMFWRRNFHPEDLPAISASVQSSESFQKYTDKLRDNLFRFLSDAKSGVPFFSARYVGHMNADLLLPAHVGYFGAMLYNNNNVASESSPVTAIYEEKVVRMLLKMIGFPESGWGYLTSGGTSANIFSLWVARNLRTLPLSLRMLIDSTDFQVNIIEKELMNQSIDIGGAIPELIHEVHRELSNNFEVETAKGDIKTLREMESHELANIPISELNCLRDRAIKLVQSVGDSGDSKVAEILFDSLIREYQLQFQGYKGFRAKIKQHLPSATQLVDSMWKIYIPASSHYSWPKAADLLGFGHRSVDKIALLPGFDIDVDALRETILADIEDGNNTWPFFFSSIFGTTEEGALDNLVSINELFKELQSTKGITIWNHTDACYGGYLASILRNNVENNDQVAAGAIDNPETLKGWLYQCAQEFGVSPEESKLLIEMSESQEGNWLTWQELIDRTSALNQSDSISIDPHKLGYIPYPCGAVLLNDHRAREVMSTDAPYLWSDGDETDNAAFTGRYTLEGSRPGAAAAACWLAHKTIPLDQSGHGKLVGLSILAARQLYNTLKENMDNPGKEERVALVHQPHTNIVCYAPYHTRYTTLQDTNEITQFVLNKLYPTNKVKPFMAVSTNLSLATDSFFEEGLSRTSTFYKMLAESGNQVNDVKVIRSVVMGPLSLNAFTDDSTTGGRKKLIFQAYAEHLEGLIKIAGKSILKERALNSASQWTRHMNTMVMDDDSSTVIQLKNSIPILNHDKISDHLQYCETESSALKEINNYNNPLDIVFLDIDMRGPSSDPKGRRDAGFHAFEAIMERNSKMALSNFKVKVVFFFTKGYMDFDKRIELIRSKYPGVSIGCERIDRNAVSRGADESDRLQVAEEILKRISLINI